MSIVYTYVAGKIKTLGKIKLRQNLFLIRRETTKWFLIFKNQLWIVTVIKNAAHNFFIE
jgi:hypothetical protein